MATKQDRPSAYERLQSFIGIIEEGDPDLSENTGKRFRELLENRSRAGRAVRAVLSNRGQMEHP